MIFRRQLFKQTTFSTSASHSSVIPKQQSFTSLLKICKSITHFKQTLAQILHFKLHGDPNTLKNLIIFCTHPSFNNLDYAEKIFSYVKTPCLITYNLLIKGFTKRSEFRKSLSLFCKLREDGLWPDNFTYPFVFKSIGCLGLVLDGEGIHGFVLKTGLELDGYVCNSLMDMYVQFGQMEVVRKLFDEMRVREVVSWNILISGFVKCKRFEEAIDAFCCMRRETNLRPEEATVVSTLSACAALRNFELGKEIHDYVKVELEISLIIANSLIDMYWKCGCLHLAREIFEEMPFRNVVCWTTMVSGYVSCGQLEEARELFERSPVRDVVLWTTMINGYVQFNRFTEAMELFKDMVNSGVRLDKFILVTALTGCARNGALEHGKWIHRYIEENRIPVDTVVATALVEMYSKCGCIEKAFEIFNGARYKDTALWTSIICGLAMNGMASEALKLFSEMKKVGIKPDYITFIGVLSACSHCGMLEKGREFFNSMKTMYQIEPNLEHYGCLIDLLGRAGELEEAEEVIRKIPYKDNKIIVQLYGSLLSACRIHRNVEMGERVAKQLLKIASNDSSVHTLLANIYASAGKWEDVLQVRSKMKDLGVKKEPGISLA